MQKIYKTSDIKLFMCIPKYECYMTVSEKQNTSVVAIISLTSLYEPPEMRRKIEHYSSIPSSEETPSVPKSVEKLMSVLELLNDEKWRYRVVWLDARGDRGSELRNRKDIVGSFKTPGK